MYSPRSATAYPMMDLARHTVDLCPDQKVLIFMQFHIQNRVGQYSLQVLSDSNFIFLRQISWTTFLALLLFTSGNFIIISPHCPSESLSKFNIVSIVTDAYGKGLLVLSDVRILPRIFY